jgi:hypothetical protein
MQSVNEQGTQLPSEARASVTKPAEQASQTNPYLQETQFERVEHAMHVVGEVTVNAYPAEQPKQFISLHVKQPVPYVAGQSIVH